MSISRRDFLKMSGATAALSTLPSGILRAAEGISPWPISDRQEQPQLMSAQNLVGTILKPKYPNVKVAVDLSNPIQYNRATGETLRIQPYAESLDNLSLLEDEGISVASVFKIVIALIGFSVLPEWSGV